MVAIGSLLALLVAVTVLAGPINRVLAATTAQLFDPAPYVSVVLETPGKKITYKGEAGAEKAGAAPADDTGAKSGAKSEAKSDTTSEAATKPGGTH
jgi:multicomponent K+:H+ antiporter subunit D